MQHNLGVQVEKVAKENVSDRDTDMVAAELSQAPGCAACVTRAEKRKTQNVLNSVPHMKGMVRISRWHDRR